MTQEAEEMLDYVQQHGGEVLMWVMIRELGRRHNDGLTYKVEAARKRYLALLTRLCREGRLQRRWEGTWQRPVRYVRLPEPGKGTRRIYPDVREVATVTRV